VRRLRRCRALITVTQDAINQMNSILEKKEDTIVRYELRGGGCGGLIAEWKTEPHHEPEQGEMTWDLAQGTVLSLYHAPAFDLRR